MSITITVEDETIPYSLYKLVRDARTEAMNAVQAEPGYALDERRLDWMQAHLVAALRRTPFHLYRGGHHLAVHRDNLPCYSGRVILVAEE